MPVTDKRSPRPKLIGITGPSAFMAEMVQMVERFFGACPVLIYADGKNNVMQLVDMCDAIILAGGVDIHPKTYNQSCLANRNMRQFDLRRDERETRIIDHCIGTKKPMMGICRGHQLLGIQRLKCSIVTDLCADSAIIHNPNVQEPKMALSPLDPMHYVDILPGRDFLGMRDKAFGDEVLWVNSFHHQGLLYQPTYTKGKRIGKPKHADDHRIVGTAYVNAKYDVVELVINKEENWMSCQWHPEFDWFQQESSKIFLGYWAENFLERRA